MNELSIGQQVELEYGDTATVTGIIGSGGQGKVYAVEYNGKKWALKWYDVSKMKDPEQFRGNIRRNISDGAPSNKFLWPQYLTKVAADGTFGYLMDMKPDSFDAFTDILNTYKLKIDPLTGQAVRMPVRFTNLRSMITAAINISNAFRQLHRAGKSYQDLNDGGFFINIDTGAVLVCDCDNIAPDGSNFGIGGKPGYMAPEIVRGIAKPDVQTDKYSLAVVLFKLLFRGDPLEGQKVVRDVCLTESAELKHYGADAVFVYDPDDDSNRPVRGIHDNVIKFWKMYPDYIRDAFIKSFTVGLTDPNKRIIENEWQTMFIRLRSEIIFCSCGRTNYTCMFEQEDRLTYRCPKCGMTFATLAFSDRDYRVPLYIGSRFYECEIDPASEDYASVAGELVENKLKPGVLGIRNSSELTWNVRMPDGEFHTVSPGKGCPIWQGLEIDFGKVTAKI